MRRYLLKKPFSEIEKVYYDTVIIGSGIAGVYTALCLNSEKETVIITKDTIDMSNSVLAQGGIAVSLDSDSLHCILQDTLRRERWYNEEAFGYCKRSGGSNRAIIGIRRNLTKARMSLLDGKAHSKTELSMPETRREKKCAISLFLPQRTKNITIKERCLPWI